MGVAAYNRGSAAISRQIAEAQTSAPMKLLQDLTEYSNRHDGATLLSETIVRFEPAGPTRPRHHWHVMNHPEKGWASYSRWYRSLWEVARTYRLAFVGTGEDECSFFFKVVPLAPRTT